MAQHLVDGFIFFLTLNLFLFHANATLPKPKIDRETIPYVFEGQDIELTCHAGEESEKSEEETGFLEPFSLEWVIPKKADNSTARFITEDIRTNTANQTQEENLKFLTTKLKIQNITKLDEGKYTCSSKNYYNNYSISDTKYIKVYSKDTTLIINSEIIDVYTRWEDSAEWILTSFTDPNVNFTLTWFGPNETDLTELSRSSDKYIVNISEKYPYKIVLRIKNISVTDTGNYTVIVKNEQDRKTVFLQLFVWKEPMITELKGERFYKLNVPKNVSCKAFGYPHPKIEWRFLSYDYNMLDSECSKACYSKIIKNRYNKTKELGEYIIESTIELDMKESGILQCSASNKMGATDSSISIRIDTFESIKFFKNQKEYVVGDDVLLTCEASIHECHTIWMIRRKDGNDISNSTKFVFHNDRDGNNKIGILDRQKLAINNVDKTDSGIYVCDTLGFIFSELDKCKKEINITVLDFQAPKITETNLNNEELVVTSEPFSLNCSATGVPSPTISWYKDEELISSSQFPYELLNHNQTLKIRIITKNEEGKYRCNASNRAEFDEAYITLKLKDQYETNIQFVLLGVSFLFIVCLSNLIYCICRKKRKKRAVMINFIIGTPESINPDLPLDDQTDLLPYDPKWEFPRKKLVCGKQLGAGAFGIVMKAEAFGVVKKNQWTTVAVKMVKRHTDPIYVQALASELKIMIYLGKHLNVVNLLGACTKNLYKQKLLLIVEFCTFGNIHQYLLRNRDKFINQIDPDTGEIDVDHIGDQHLLSDAYSDETLNRTENYNSSFQHSTKPRSRVLILREITKKAKSKKLTTSTLVCWAFQIARGMEYLASKRVVHGDLAARNVLLTDHNIVKICDFGLAKKIYNNPNYKKSTNCLLPVHWMALECLMDGIYSTETDVWSYGIVLWELFSLAKKPYAEFDDYGQLREKLIQGYRMSCPLYANKYLHDTMLECWSQHPSRRPSFRDLSMRLEKLLEKNMREHYLELDSIFRSSSLSALEDDDYCKLVENTTDSKRYVNIPTCNTRLLDETSLGNSECLEMRCRRFSSDSPQGCKQEEIEKKPTLTKSVEDGYLVP